MILLIVTIIHLLLAFLVVAGTSMIHHNAHACAALLPTTARCRRPALAVVLSPTYSSTM
jgi:hypothetical protein